MGDAYPHALDEIRMRVVAELVGDQCSDGLDLLLGDRHRLPIAAHQAGDTDRREHLQLLLERKVTKEIALEQGQLNQLHAVGPAAPLLPQRQEGMNRLGGELIPHPLFAPGACLNSVPAKLCERVD
jgi:hypothetical protein